MAVRVQLVDASRENPVDDLAFPDGTTVRSFLAGNKVDTSKATVTVRRAHQNVNYHLDDELKDGDRVTVTPSQVKGA